MRRKPEFILGIVTAVVIIATLINFPLSAFHLSEETYLKVYKPMYAADLKGVSNADGITLLKNLSIWITVTLVVMVIFTVLGTIFVRGNRSPKKAAIFYALAGILTLVGIQNIGYPFAYLFFIIALMCIFRKVDGYDGPPKKAKKVKKYEPKQRSSLY